MQRLEVSGAVRLIYRSLGVKGLNWEGEFNYCWVPFSHFIAKSHYVQFKANVEMSITCVHFINHNH